MSSNGFSMKMVVQCHECATNLEFMIVSSSHGNGDLFQISVSPCPFCESLRQKKSLPDLLEKFEERNLAIIEAVMNELGVIDIEELPAKVIELKAVVELMHVAANKKWICSYCELPNDSDAALCINCRKPRIS